MTRDPHELPSAISTYRDLTNAAGRPPGQITAMTGLPLGDPTEAGALCEAYMEAGVDRLVCGMRYDSIDQYQAQLEQLATVREALTDD